MPPLPFSFFVLRFERVPYHLPGAAYAFGVRMGVHPKRDRRITVAQSLRHADNIRTVCDRDACGAVTEFVRMEALNTVSFPEALKISCGCLREHRICRPVLCEYPFADARGRLFFTEEAQQAERFWSEINCARPAILRCGDINALQRIQLSENFG